MSIFIRDMKNFRTFPTLGKKFLTLHLILYSHGGVNPIYPHNKETNTLLNYSVAVFMLKEVGSVPWRKRRGIVRDKAYDRERNGSHPQQRAGK
jgi:hypothetical protein